MLPCAFLSFFLVSVCLRGWWGTTNADGNIIEPLLLWRVMYVVMANKFQKHHQSNSKLQDELVLLRGRMTAEDYSRPNHAESFMPNRGNTSINKSFYVYLLKRSQKAFRFFLFYFCHFDSLYMTESCIDSLNYISCIFFNIFRIICRPHNKDSSG